MITRRAVALLFGLAALLAPSAARGQAIGAGLGGGTSSPVSRPFDVPVIVDMTARPERLGAFALRIQWNAAVLQFQVGLPGSFGNLTANTDSAPQGIIRLAGANPAGVAGLITLGVGRFVPLVADTTTLRLTFSELFAAGTYADLRPSLSVSNGQFCSATGRYGDIDGDGQSNSRDALIALESAVGLDVSAYPIALGDVDGNGVTDTRDALVMLSAGVGIDVSAFPRLGQVLGGACAPAVPVTMAIAPPAVTGLEVGQAVSFELRAAGPTGALVTIPGATFRSSNPSVLAFSPVAPSTAGALATGTVTVTAVRDAKDSVQTSVTVVGRRMTHWVDAKAVNALNQLGTQALPFATIGAAIQVAVGGDTIRPQPGRYEESVVVDSAVVLLGDTLSDGTRPVLAGLGTGILLTGSGSREVQYLELAGFATAVDVDGPSHVLVRGVRTGGVAYGITATGSPIGQLRIEASRLVGNGANGFSGSGVNLGSPVDTLVVQGTEISDFGIDGIDAGGADSVAVLGSRVHDVGVYGVNAGVETPFAFVMDNSTISAAYQAVWVTPVRSAAFSHNHLAGGSASFGGVNVGGNGSGWVSFRGDSLQGIGVAWLNAGSLDSLAMDSAWVNLPSSVGTASDVKVVRVTNTQFVNVQGQPLSVTSSANAGSVVALDNVQVTGDPRCDMCVLAFSLRNARTTANNVTGTNLGLAFSATGDSSLTVTNSLFKHVGTGIATTDTGTAALLVVRNSQFLGFGDAITANGGPMVVDSNTFQGSTDYAILVNEPGAAVQIVGNAFSGVANGMNLSAFARPMNAAITDNVLTGVSGRGIAASGGADSVAATLQVLRNSVTCDQAGATSGYGVYQTFAHSVIANNQVAGCWSGIQAIADQGIAGALRRDSIVGNTVTMPSGSTYGGIYVTGAVQARIGANTVTADTVGQTNNGDIWLSGVLTSGGLVTALVDSNQVAGGSYYGIFVGDVDSAAILSNVVRGVTSAACIGCSEGGIVAAGPLRGAALIHGNLVRQVAGVGISAENTDTALVVVDSNLVSGNTYGMSLGQGSYVGSVHVTRNRIVGDTAQFGYGVYIYYADSIRTVLDSNNITGNRFGVYAVGGTYQAPNNWWGDSAGPTCAVTLEICSQSVTGDSVSSGVAWQPQLSAPMPTGLPLSAPPVALMGRTRAMAAARSVTAAAAPTVRGAGHLAVRVAPPAPSRVGTRLPQGLSAVRREALRQQLDRLNAGAEAGARNLTAVAAAASARAAERAAWLSVVRQSAAVRDSAAAARSAEQVAAQQARHARPR